MLAATIRDAGLSLSIRFRNLSPSGALVEGDELPPEGAAILLQYNGHLLRSHVVWADGRRGGIRFEQPVSLSSSLRQVATPKPPPPERSRRPGLKCKPLTENEKRILGQWVALGVTAAGD